MLKSKSSNQNELRILKSAKKTCPKKVLEGVLCFYNTLCIKTILHNAHLTRCDNGTHFYLIAHMAEWYGASALGAVDSGLISSWVKPMTLKLAFIASLLDAQH